MTYVPITNAEVDAESPLDDNLFAKIQQNFADHEARIQVIKGFPLEWRVNGMLNNLNYSVNKRLDGNRIVATQTMTAVNVLLDRPGIEGTLEIDIRKYRSVSTGILSILSMFSGSLSSVANVAPALATQSITR